MSLSAAEKKRKQRDRAKRGSRAIPVEIMDWGAWIEILRYDSLLHGADTPGAVRLATEAFIWDLCRDYRREKAKEQLSEIRSPITGLIDREMEPIGGCRLIKAKDVRRPN